MASAAAVASVGASRTGEKRARIVARACDACRHGKRKCDGSQPCANCKNGDKHCSYDLADKRRTKSRPTPSLSPFHETSANGLAHSVSSDGQAETSISSAQNARIPAREPAVPELPLPRPRDPAGPSDRDQTRPASSQVDADLVLLARAIDHATHSPDTRIADADIVNQNAQPGFVERLHRHLKTTLSLRSFPRGGVNVEDGELLPGQTGTGDMAAFFLPSRQEAAEYVSAYFEQAAATYRYLDRSEIEDELSNFYEKGSHGTKPSQVVLLLLVMSVGCLWSPADPAVKTQRASQLFSAAQLRLDKLRFFPPRLVIFQAYLLTVQLQLGLAQYQRAWLSFGQAARYAQLLGLHRLAPEPATDEHLRRRCFWSAYQMDRQISLVLGLPVLFNEADITQAYFDVPSLSGAGGEGDDSRALIGSLANIKLSRILGHASEQLRDPKTLPPLQRDVIVAQLETELAVWLQETPAFFHPNASSTSGNDGFTQIPEFFLRQRRMVQMTYHFIRLFLNRSYLLSMFLDRLPGATGNAAIGQSVPTQVASCVDAAIAIAELAAAFRSSTKGVVFWITSYYTFASLTVLCVYLMLYDTVPDRARIEAVIGGAMQGHERLTGAVDNERQQIILESRRIAAILRERKTAAQAVTPDLDSLEIDFSQFEQLPPSATEDAALPDWNSMWLDMQGLVQLGLDPTTGLAFQPAEWQSTYMPP